MDYSAEYLASLTMSRIDIERREIPVRTIDANALLAAPVRKILAVREVNGAGKTLVARNERLQALLQSGLQVRRTRFLATKEGKGLGWLASGQAVSRVSYLTRGALSSGSV